MRHLSTPPSRPSPSFPVAARLSSRPPTASRMLLHQMPQTGKCPLFLFECPPFCLSARHQLRNVFKPRVPPWMQGAQDIRAEPLHGSITPSWGGHHTCLLPCCAIKPCCNRSCWGRFNCHVHIRADLRQDCLLHCYCQSNL